MYEFSFEESSRDILDSLRRVIQPAAGSTGYPMNTMANTISQEDYNKAAALIEMREERSVSSPHTIKHKPQNILPYEKYDESMDVHMYVCMCGFVGRVNSNRT